MKLNWNFWIRGGGGGGGGDGWRFNPFIREGEHEYVLDKAYLPAQLII